MRRRRACVVVLVVIGLVAAACSNDESDRDRGAARQQVGPAAIELADLPALAAPADDGSPRGLPGDRWAVYLPASVDLTRPAVGVVGGVRAVLVDGAGDTLTAPVTYTLWDQLSTKGPAPIYTGDDPNVPDGLLRNGGTYQYTVTDAKGLKRGPFTFTVNAAGGVSGAYAAGVQAETVRSGAGELGIGISFTTADVGTTPELDSVEGFRAGLPPGWRWTGLGSGITSVVVEDAGGFYGFEKIVEVHRDGGGVELLGCIDGGAWGCSPIDGDSSGTGLQATFEDDASTLTLHDPAERRTWSVATWSAPRTDDTADQLARRAGRVTSSWAPGGAEIAYEYAADEGEEIAAVRWKVGGDGPPMTWTIFREGDPGCAGDLPRGFVATPDGAVCGWELPTGDWIRLLFVAPGGSAAPQIGRVLRLPGPSASPAGCAPGDPARCQSVWDQVAVTDWAWSTTGHPRAMREPGVAQAVMAGAVRSDEASVTTRVQYDEQGRTREVASPARVPGGASLVATTSYPAPDTGFPGASHQLTTRAAASDGSVPAQQTVVVVDDGLRQVGSIDATGARATEVWRSDRNLQLARIGSDGSATTQVFDAQDRQIASYDVPRGSLNLEQCKTGTSNPAACAPTGGWSQVSAELTTYDGAGVPGGLTAEWYGDSSLTGIPLARTAVDTIDAGTSSFVLDPPEGLTGGGVRITGALLGPTPQILGVSVKGGKSDAVRAFVDHRFYGALPGGGGTLDLEEPDQPVPLRLELVITFGQPPTGLRVANATDGDDVRYSAKTTRQRWGAATETRSVEAYPAGSSTFSAVAKRSTYGDIDAPAATATATVGCGTFPSWEAATSGCSGSVAVEEAQRYEDDGFGGTRLASTSTPGGDETTYEYWGKAETPAGAGVPGADDLPAEVAGTPQHGLLQSVRRPDGRVTTIAYDGNGRPACTATSSGGPTAWSCTSYDGGGRVTREVHRSPTGAPPVVIDVEYGIGDGPSPRTATQVRSEGDRVVSTEKISLSAAGRVTSYEQRVEGESGAGAAATTTFAYDAFDRPTETATTVALGDGTASFRTGRTYAGGSGLLDTVTVDGAPVAKVRYGGPSPWLMSGVSYPGAGSLSMDLGYDGGIRPVARTWTLGDGSKVDDATTTTTGGRILAARFDGVDTTYAYDPIGRLTTSTTATPEGPTTSQYGWNANGDLVCTARGLDAPAPSCTDAPGHVTNTYERGRLTATTDPDWTLGASPYDAAGNLAELGDRTLTYDARQQVAEIERGDETLAITRDSSGRALVHAGADGATRFLYAAPDDPTPVATLPPGGGVSFSTALPGGVVWTTGGAAITDTSGSPALWLAPDGTRDAERPTVRYGPFGEVLTGDPAAPDPPAGDPTTTTTSSSSTTTSLPIAPDPGDATTTTIEAVAPGPEPDAGPGDAGSTTTTAPEATTTTDATTGESTTTTEATSAESTTTTEAATTTTPESTTTTTTTASAPASDGLDPHGWSDRMAIDEGIVDLGQRAMVPSLGIFTGPDPVPGGSCTVYGYTCSDPINASDLGGTALSTGAIVGVLVTALLSLAVPGGSLMMEAVFAVLMGAGSSVLGLVIQTSIDQHGLSSLHLSDYVQAAITGAVVGAATALVGSGLTMFTKFERPLETLESDYGYAVRGVKENADVLGGQYAGYRTMGGIRHMAMRFVQIRSSGQAFITAGRWPLVRNGLSIFGAKQGVNVALHYVLKEYDVRWGVLSSN